MVENKCVVILVSADAEWLAIRDLIPESPSRASPYGDWFNYKLDQVDLIFLHGGWGKIAAAGSTQFAIDKWHPDLLINFGTCGGFAGKIDKNMTLLVDRTIVYDIDEQMGEIEAHIAHYTTVLDLSWLIEPFPIPVKRSLLISGDRDLRPHEIAGLGHQYSAVAGDWESGAIAYVAARNNTRCLILRGVSDLVGDDGSEAYGNLEYFSEAARQILISLFDSLSGWLRCAGILMPAQKNSETETPQALSEK